MRQRSSNSGDALNVLITSAHCVLQNQLLTKGMVILRDKIRFYEGGTAVKLTMFCVSQSIKR